MRPITAAQIFTFVVAMGFIAALSGAGAWLGVGRLPLGDFRGVVVVGAGVVFLYVCAIAVYRLLLAAVPLKVGVLEVGTKEEFVYQVYLLFFLVLFYPVMRSGMTPVPMLRLFYQALGAKLGANTYSSGILFDPLLIELGRDCIVGQSSMVIPHVIEGQRLELHRVTVGNNVTIGANAIVLAGCTVGDNAIVAAGAIVSKGTVIGSGEVWGGVPARLLAKKDGPPRA